MLDRFMIIAYTTGIEKLDKRKGESDLWLQTIKAKEHHRHFSLLMRT